MKFDKEPLAVEQNDYMSKILNIYIAYNLDACPKIPLRNFSLKNCLFGVTNIVQKTVIKKSMYIVATE